MTNDDLRRGIYGAHTTWTLWFTTGDYGKQDAYPTDHGLELEIRSFLDGGHQDAGEVVVGGVERWPEFFVEDFLDDL